MTVRGFFLFPFDLFLRSLYFSDGKGYGAVLLVTLANLNAINRREEQHRRIHLERELTYRFETLPLGAGEGWPELSIRGYGTWGKGIERGGR